MAAKRNPEEIQRMVEGSRQSGMKRAKYCRSQGIPVTTLDYYHHRQALESRPRLEEVKVTPESSPAGSFALLLRTAGGSRAVGTSGDADLARLIRVAEAH
jgi:hypothetical protein